MMRTCDIETIADRLKDGTCPADERPGLLRDLDQIASDLESQIKGIADVNSSSTIEDDIMSLVKISDLFAKLGEWEKSVAIFHAIQGVHQRGYSKASVAEAIKQQGKLYRFRGKWSEALEAYEIALDVYSDMGDTKGLADINNSIGITNFENGSWDKSETHYLKALELIEEQAPELRAKIYNNLGALYNARGDCDNAMSSYLRSIPDFQTSENHLGLAQAYHNLGMSFAGKNDWENAAEYYEKSLEISRKLNVLELSALTYLNMAELYVNTSSPAQAEEYCKMAVSILTDQDDKLGLAEAHKILGVVERLKNNWAEARSHFELSITLNEECSSPLGLAEAYYEFGRTCRDEGKTEESHGLLSKSLAIFEKLKASKSIADVRSEVVKLDKLYLEIIEALGTAVENKDSYTMGHSSRVAHFSLMLAESLDLDQEMVKGIVIAAYLHDIGKIYVGDEILNKPGKLTNSEFETIKRHPEMGVASLSAVEFPWQVKQYILHHHERHDGSGYPGGLRGDEIPLGAQVIALADFFDALTSDRSYRKAWSQEQALGIITKNKGILFDRKLVSNFMGLIERRAIKADPGVRFSMTDLWQHFSKFIPAAFTA